MTVSVETVGRRHYIRAPFSAKDTLKAAGCKWDPDARSWWTGKREVADRLASELASADLGLEGFPARLPNGDWGARIPGATAETVTVGKAVKITARNRESWTATITGVVSVDGDGVTVQTSQRTTQAPKRSAAPSQPRRCRERGCTATATNRGYCDRCAFDHFDD